MRELPHGIGKVLMMMMMIMIMMMMMMVMVMMVMTAHTHTHAHMHTPHVIANVLTAVLAHASAIMADTLVDDGVCVWCATVGWVMMMMMVLTAVLAHASAIMADTLWGGGR